MSCHSSSTSRGAGWWTRPRRSAVGDERYGVYIGTLQALHTCIHNYLCIGTHTYIRTYLHPGLGEDQRKNCGYISHVAQVSDTAQVTRQVSLLEIIV